MKFHSTVSRESESKKDNTIMKTSQYVQLSFFAAMILISGCNPNAGLGPSLGSANPSVGSPLLTEVGDVRNSVENLGSAFASRFAPGDPEYGNAETLYRRCGVSLAGFGNAVVADIRSGGGGNSSGMLVARDNLDRDLNSFKSYGSETGVYGGKSITIATVAALMPSIIKYGSQVVGAVGREKAARQAQVQIDSATRLRPFDQLGSATSTGF